MAFNFQDVTAIPMSLQSGELGEKGEEPQELFSLWPKPKTTTSYS